MGQVGLVKGMRTIAVVVMSSFLIATWAARADATRSTGQSEGVATRATCTQEIHPPVIALDPRGRRYISFSAKQICPTAQLQHVCVRGRERTASGTWVALTVKVCNDSVAFDLIAQVQVSCADAGHGTYRTRGWASTWSTAPVLLPDSEGRTLC